MKGRMDIAKTSMGKRNQSIQAGEEFSMRRIESEMDMDLRKPDWR